MLKDLIIKNRSYRRFDPTVHVTMDELSEMCEAARLSGYGMNIQSTKYILINDSKTCKLITENCVWAGYLTDWQGPARCAAHASEPHRQRRSHGGDRARPKTHRWPLVHPPRPQAI